jgi:3'-5' exoribonuclease
MILSHQGALEHGSPILPQTLEALILSFVDANSADMNQATKHIEKELETGEDFSGYHKWLGRSFYMKDRLTSEKSD